MPAEGKAGVVAVAETRALRARVAAAGSVVTLVSVARRLAAAKKVAGAGLAAMRLAAARLAGRAVPWAGWSRWPAAAGHLCRRLRCSPSRHGCVALR